MASTKKESVVDQMADDATPPEYPDGAPALKSFLDLRPRSRRAEFKRKFATFQGSQQKLSAARDGGLLQASEDEVVELTPEQQQARLAAWADADDMFQLMDDLMLMCADDPDVYRAWSEKANDDLLSKVFSTFMVRSQPGEASSSAS